MESSPARCSAWSCTLTLSKGLVPLDAPTKGATSVEGSSKAASRLRRMWRVPVPLVSRSTIRSTNGAPYWSSTDAATANAWLFVQSINPPPGSGERNGEGGDGGGMGGNGGGVEGSAPARDTSSGVSVSFTSSSMRSQSALPLNALSGTVLTATLPSR